MNKVLTNHPLYEAGNMFNFFLSLEKIFLDVMHNMAHTLSFYNYSKISYILTGRIGKGGWAEFLGGLLINWSKHGIILTLFDS